MFSIGKDQVYWIPTAQFDEDFVGFLPELKDWIDANAKAVLDRVTQTDTSKLSSEEMSFHERLIEILSDPFHREQFVLDDLQYDAWLNLVGRRGMPPGIFDKEKDPADTAERVQSLCRN